MKEKTNSFGGVRQKKEKNTGQKRHEMSEIENRKAKKSSSTGQVLIFTGHFREESRKALWEQEGTTKRGRGNQRGDIS